MGRSLESDAWNHALNRYHDSPRHQKKLVLLREWRLSTKQQVLACYRPSTKLLELL